MWSSSSHITSVSGPVPGAQSCHLTAAKKPAEALSPVGRPRARLFLQGPWLPGAVFGEVFLVLSLPCPEPSPFGLIDYGRLSCAK